MSNIPEYNLPVPDLILSLKQAERKKLIPALPLPDSRLMDISAVSEGRIQARDR